MAGIVVFVCMRTIQWVNDSVRIIDQTRLPHETVFVALTDVGAVVDAIQRLAVRGAPAIGVAGALGVALAIDAADRRGADDNAIIADAQLVRHARPTAVNLAWAVDRVLAALPMGRAAARATALAMVDEDVAINAQLSRRGAALVTELVGRDRDLRVHTHCNAGSLACVEWGTALGVVRALHSEGRITLVVADETRPLLQGSRLTAWELTEIGVDYRIVTDGAGPSIIARGLVDAVIVGADRVAANGDVVNKIGTFPLAMAAARAGIPFVVAAPESTIDLATDSGSDIEIEFRDEKEVLSLNGSTIAPEGATAWNPAFDVTPADLVTALVTERRTLRIDRGERP